MSGANKGPVAAVDCGTNSTRLLILDESGGRLERRMTITRLGAGIDRSGRLEAAAISRTLEVLSEFADCCRRYGVNRLAAVATSASRDAANGEEFLGPASEILGVRPEVISGMREGQLSYVGATHDLEPWEGPYLVVDIGGGSTELVLGRPEKSPQVAAVRSIDIGCVRFTERYLEHDPPLAREVAKGRRAVRELLDEALGDRPEWRAANRLIGLAGTVSALAVLALGLERFEEDRVHHAQLRRETVQQLTKRLADRSVAERKQMVGMEQARADVILGGAIVFEEVMDHLHASDLIVSESDILDGLALSILEGG